MRPGIIGVVINSWTWNIAMYFGIILKIVSSLCLFLFLFLDIRLFIIPFSQCLIAKFILFLNLIPLNAIWTNFMTNLIHFPNANHDYSYN